MQLGMIGSGLIAWMLMAVITSPATSDEPAPRSITTINGSPVAACSSAGCHGGGAVGQVGSEQSTWASNDPHAKAFRILFNDDSIRITKNLRRTEPSRPAAHQDASCLACHSTGGNACYEGTMMMNAADSVGCDACHGASSQWLSLHYEPSWKALSNDQKAKFGFQPTKDLVSRITACVGCHVGDAKREVSHDLIAAGHPRLAFEYTRYHYSKNYSKHWTEPLPTRDFEVRTWAIGQIVAMKAAVQMLHERTEPTKFGKTPWPELSEQGCFACHKGLTQPLKETSNRSIGTPDWQPWYLATLEILAGESPAIFSGSSAVNLKPLNELAGEMQKPKPDPAEVHKLAGVAESTLSQWIAEIRTSESKSAGSRITSDVVHRLAGAIAKHGERETEWDRVAPHFLAVAAIYHADAEAFPGWKEPLEKLKTIVNYPAGFNSPKSFDAKRSQELFRELGAK